MTRTLLDEANSNVLYLRFDLTDLWHRTKPNLSGGSIPEAD